MTNNQVESVRFSQATRLESLRRFKNEVFDFLVIGGGITGAAVARDAASRGFKVALVEKKDFAWGTSSRSSKLVHGGLRYLENFEFRLVFEALSERTFLLKSMRNLVKPLPFYMPIYEGDPHGMNKISMGLWLYDLLALFRAPGFHKRLGRDRFREAIPAIRSHGLKGGFRYFDASMWDDALAVETLRSASAMGAAIANYVEAVTPLYEPGPGDSPPVLKGFRCYETLSNGDDGAMVDIKAHKTIVCAGPWTDHVGARLSPGWMPWLAPSKGVHLVFDLKRIPLPGAIVMSHPQDGRISFVIPRPDFGQGIVVVGTTDGPTDADPEKALIYPHEVHYLMELLKSYFPSLNLTTDDIVSAYVGVRPLMGAQGATTGSEGQGQSAAQKQLQKVSREHYIATGPGGAVLVAGGKYTTHRTMAQEIVEYAIHEWKKDLKVDRTNRPALPAITKSKTKLALTPAALSTLPVDQNPIHARLFDHYGADALRILELSKEIPASSLRELSPEAPFLGEEFLYSIRFQMTMRLEDFYFRRMPLFLSRRDHGLPFVQELSKIWARELGKTEIERKSEIEALQSEISRRERWRTQL